MTAAKIAVLYYSTYGHIKILAESVAKGVKETGASVDILQIPETLSPEILKLLHAQPKADYPVISNPEILKEYDGFLLGIPTRYGRAPAQWSAFFDATGAIWATGGLVGKFASVFSSTASQHGGQETTAVTTFPFFAHHGINYVPIGFAEPTKVQSDNGEVVGGSPYGAGTLANGDGSRLPSEKELTLAAFHGKHFATQVGYSVAGKAALAAK